MTGMGRLHRLLPALAVVVGAAVGVPAAAVPAEPEDRPEKQVAENLFGGLRTGLENLRAKVRAEAGVLSTPVPQQASGELVTIPLEHVAPVVDGAEGPGQARTVRVQVEDGLPVNGPVFAEYVLRILTDERGWGHDGSVTFVPYPADVEPQAAEDDGAPPDDAATGPPDITVALASPALVDELCVPLRTAGKYSCGRNATAALNVVRWAEGAAPFFEGGGNLPAYRRYLVNHEVGHLLGHQHTPCPEPGAPAPVMLQQTMRLDGCTPNGWPVDDPA